MAVTQSLRRPATSVRNGEELDQHHPRSRLKLSSIVGTFLLCCLFPLAVSYMLHAEGLAVGILSQQLQLEAMLQFAEPNQRSSSSSQLHHDQKLCPHIPTLYASNTTARGELEHSIDQATAFHTQGGSLKSIQRFLDRQIHPTLERLDVTFRERDTNNAGMGSSPRKPKRGTLRVIEYLQDYYQHHEVLRGGYGQPLPIIFQDKSSDGGFSAVNKVLHGTRRDGQRWIDVMEEATPERFQVAVGPIGPSCPNMMHFSELKNLQEKSFCADSRKDNHTRQDGDDQCHIFSIGSNDQWGFETELRQKLPHCHTHTFDCTLKGGTPKRKPKDDMVHFYSYCVTGDTAAGDSGVSIRHGRSYLSYMGLWKATTIRYPPKLLKMDVEGFEFDVVTSMLSSFESSDWWPEQIMMEVHFSTRMVDLEWMLRTRQSAELALFFGSLWNAGGYIPIKVQYFGVGCPSCLEVLLLRVLCREKLSFE